LSHPDAEGAVTAPDATASAHAYLRDEILSGRLDPGSFVNQVHVARQLKISRGPLREALRLLENEGLVVSEQNRRSRVAPLTAADAEDLYCLRSVTEALAIRISAPLLTPDDIAGMREAFDAMNGAEAASDVPAWQEAHRRFHSTSIVRSRGRVNRLAEELREHAARYVQLYYGVLTNRGPTDNVKREHEEILEACMLHDGDSAAALLTKHLGHTGLGVLTYIDPLYEPIALRSVLRHALKT
jgi:DNA-binding GntR family transcriptional regulator